MIKDDLTGDITKVIIKLGVGAENVEVVPSSSETFGNYSSNVAFKFSHKNKQTPMEFAKVLADSLHSLPYIKKLEVVKPGFINFWIKDELLVKEVEDLLNKKKFKGKLAGKKVIVEYTDPNPFKEFHIGHLYSNSVGEAISRLIEATGAEVKRANYQGDVGMHVAKCVWGMRRKYKKSKVKSQYLDELEKASLDKKIKFLGESYSLGANEFEKNLKIREEITELNREIYKKGEEIEEYKLGKKWSLEHFEEVYRRLGTKFDFYYFEGQVGEFGASLVRDHIKDGVFEKSKGAIIFPGEKYGLHSRVFINSLGLPTYEAKELGLAPKKYEDFAYDVSVIITGNEINEYFKVLLCALDKIRPDLASKTKHIGHGMVKMPGGKMSSRVGNVLLGEWLLDEAKKHAEGIISQKGIAKGDKSLSEKVAVGAVKYSLLKNNVGQDSKFDFEESVNFDGNSGPYLQYTHARAKSVIAKAKNKAQSAKILDWANLEKQEARLLSHLANFEAVVLESAENYCPNTVATYLFELAQKFNAFYNDLPILGTGEKASRRLLLTSSTAVVLSRGLNLLGIEAPNKM